MQFLGEIKRLQVEVMCLQLELSTSEGRYMADHAQ